MNVALNIERIPYMKLQILYVALVGLSFGGAAVAQQYEPLAETTVNEMAIIVQDCFSKATAEDQARECLINIESVITAAGAFDGPQTAMNMGAHDISRILDVVLNTEYQLTIRVLRGFDNDSYVVTVWDPVTDTEVPYRYVETLRESQRAWIGFRDAECRVRSANNLGGTVYGSVFGFCISNLTEIRVMDLILIRMGAFAVGEYSPDNFRYDEYR